MIPSIRFNMDDSKFLDNSKALYRYNSYNYRIENGKRCFDKFWYPTTCVESSRMSKQDRDDLNKNFESMTKLPIVQSYTLTQ